MPFCHQTRRVELIRLCLGDVIWVDQANATQSHLAYVNDAGHAIIKVDNTTNVPWNYKRNSVSIPLSCYLTEINILVASQVRITSEDYFSVGSVLVFDATHLPYGCSVSLTSTTYMDSKLGADLVYLRYGRHSGRKARTGPSAARSTSSRPSTS